MLRKSFIPLDREFQFATSSDAADVEAIQDFLQESIAGNCEVQTHCFAQELSSPVRHLSLECSRQLELLGHGAAGIDGEDS